jgi:membrane-associated phospholipid phosphatase
MRFISPKRVTWRCAPILAILVALAAPASAQSQAPASPTPTPQPSPTPSLERRFLKNILHDQVAIFTSPFHISKGDTKFLLPLALSTGALLATDRRTAGSLSQDQTRLDVSRDISFIGSYGAGGVAAAFYLVGRAEHNARARETGLLGAEALFDGVVVSTVLKNVTQRPRPGDDGGRGDFFDGGHSFPSGHATSAWALAAVVANEYHDKRIVQITAYGLATAVSISRFTGRNHFLSDVLVGSAIGYGIGRYVYRTHHDQTLDAHGQVRPHSKLFPVVSPHYSGHLRGSMVTLAWNL